MLKLPNRYSAHGCSFRFDGYGWLPAFLDDEDKHFVIRVVVDGKKISAGDKWPILWSEQRPRIFAHTYSWRRAIGLGFGIIAVPYKEGMRSWYGGDLESNVPAECLELYDG